MASPLVPCPACDRHVRADERACPFCSAPLPDDLAGHAVPPAPGRLGRAAAFVFGATLSVTACSGDVTQASSGGVTDGGAGGGPQDDGGGQAHYGMPAFDGGAQDDGGGMALYGDPPPPDAGPDDAGDGGGGQALYGSPPPPPKHG